MKRFVSIILMIVTISAAFAYEPKIEYVKVKRNGDIKYYEKTEPYNDLGLLDLDEDHVQWVIRKGYTIEQFTDYQYGRLELLRNTYNSCMNEVKNPKPTKLTNNLVDFKKKYLGTEISPEEQATHSLLKLAEDKKSTAIISLVFVTEENFLTLTKEEMLNKLKIFIEECTN